MHQVVAQPAGVVVRAGDCALQLVVVDDAALAGIDQQHPSGAQPILAHDLFGWQIEHADFRRQDHQTAPGHAVARWPQAVAVEHRSHLNAVGERHRGGTVPALHQRGVVLVERLLLRAHALMIRPRLGDQHHERVRQRTPAEHQQLEGVVQLGGVAAVRVDDRQRGRQVGAEQLGTKQLLPRPHPVLVALHGVDLAVVHQVAVGMGAVPARKGVGGEPRVHQGDRRFHGGMIQFRVEAA